MCQHHTPDNHDHVGSFLRPQALKEAREKFAKGEISQEALTAVEDQAIIDLIKKQEAEGVKTITDGEFRRSWWHFDFMWGLNGVQKVSQEDGNPFEGLNTRAESAGLSGKISGENHPFVAHFKFLQEHKSDDIEAKQTIPAPAQLLQELLKSFNIEKTKEIYPNMDDLVEDIAQAYLTVINDLKAAGCHIIQLDDCTWSRLISMNSADMDEYETAEEKSQRRDELAELYLKANNAVLDRMPKDVAKFTHVCRGNYRSTWFASGGYESVSKWLFAKQNVDAYFLEYDSDRSGSFEPLKDITNGKKVVLGLVTSKTGELENKQDIIDRVKEASQYIPLEDLYISPQCGFSSTEEGNDLTDEQQWAKLALVEEVAEEIWPEDK